MTRLNAKQRDAYNLGAQSKRAGVKRENLLRTIGLDARSRRPGDEELPQAALMGWDRQAEMTGVIVRFDNFPPLKD